MPVDAGLDRSHLHVVDADGVLEVRIGGQPGDDRRSGGDGGGLDARRTQRRLLPDDHGARCVPGSPPVGCYGANADPVQLWRRRR